MEDQGTILPVVKRSRKRYPKALKEQILRECEQPNVSIAEVARRHGINHNLVHKWRYKRRRSDDSFIALPVQRSEVAPYHDTCVEFTLPSSRGGIKVSWPVAELRASVEWLKALMQ